MLPDVGRQQPKLARRTLGQPHGNRSLRLMKLRSEQSVVFGLRLRLYHDGTAPLCLCHGFIETDNWH
jgi:hypothetical protein